MAKITAFKNESRFVVAKARVSQGELVKAGSPQFRSNFRTLQSTTLASSTLQFFRHHRNTPGDGLEPISTSSSTRNQAPQQFGTAQAHESVANALVPSLAGDLRSFGKFTGNHRKSIGFYLQISRASMFSSDSAENDP